MQNSFLHVLRGVLHQRISYPSPNSAETVKDDDLAEMSAQLRGTRRERRIRRALHRKDQSAKTAGSQESQKECSSRMQQALAESFLGRKATRRVQASNGKTNGATAHTNGTEQQEAARQPGKNGHVPHNGNGIVPAAPALAEEDSLPTSESVKIETAEANR